MPGNYTLANVRSGLPPSVIANRRLVGTKTFIGLKAWARRAKKRIYVRNRISALGKQLFPSLYKTKMNFVVDGLFTIASTGSVQSFKGNSVYQSGPQTDWAGAYSVNVPSGLAYLLSTTTSSGSNAPYSHIRILSSKIKVELAPTSTALTVPLTLCIVPTLDATFTGASRTQYSEQPFAKQRMITLANTSGRPIAMIHKMSTQKLFGLKYKASLEDFQFLGTGTADPTKLWYWHVILNTADGSSQNLNNILFRITMEYYGEFSDRNVYNTTAPS